MKRLLLLLAILCAGAAAWGYRDYLEFSDRALAAGSGEAVVRLPRGGTLGTVVRDLRARGATTAPLIYWRALGHQLGAARRLHAGEYALTPGLTPRQLLERMARGQVIQHEFTIVPGWSVAELRAALARETLLEHTTTALDGEELMARLDARGVASEGRFLPETYAYVLGDDDLSILRRAHQALRVELAAQWERRDPAVKLADAEQALVLASIVEKETGRADERAQIAGVFLRRLDIGMRLQTDPTVIYGLGAQFQGNLTRLHLETDTPFNTYTRAGLPPTPIALPSREAIAAVLHPADGKALYFVAKGDGSHAFSDSLAAHNDAVSRYQLRRR